MSKLTLAGVVLVAIVAALFAWFARESDSAEPLDAAHARALDASDAARNRLDPLRTSDGIASGVARESIATQLPVAPNTAASTYAAGEGSLDVLFVDEHDTPVVVDSAVVSLAWKAPAAAKGNRRMPPTPSEVAADGADRVTFESVPEGEWEISVAGERIRSAVRGRATTVANARNETRIVVERMLRITVRVVDSRGGAAVLDDPRDGPPLGEYFSVRLMRAPCEIGSSPGIEPNPLRQSCVQLGGVSPSGFVLEAPLVRSSWIVLLHGERAVALAPAPVRDGEVTLHVAASEFSHGFGSVAFCVVDDVTGLPLPSCTATLTLAGQKPRSTSIDANGCGSFARIPLLNATLATSASGYFPSKSKLRLANGESRDLGVIRLVAGGSISVNVIDERTARFGVLQVYAWRLEGGQLGPQSLAGIIDDAYSFELLLPGEYLVSTNYRANVEDARRGALVDSVVVVLNGGAQLEVNLRIPALEPGRGATSDRR